MKRVILRTSGMAALLASSREETQSEKRAIIDAYDDRDEVVLEVAYVKIEPVPEYREPKVQTGYAPHPKHQPHPRRFRK